MLKDAKPLMEADVIAHGCWRLHTVQLRQLTPREFEVFLLLAAGWSYHEMAARLKVRDRTIRAHLAAILVKLELGSVVHARLASYGYSISCDAMTKIGEPGAWVGDPPLEETHLSRAFKKAGPVR